MKYFTRRTPLLLLLHPHPCAGADDGKLAESVGRLMRLMICRDEFFQNGQAWPVSPNWTNDTEIPWSRSISARIVNQPHTLQITQSSRLGEFREPF